MFSNRHIGPNEKEIKKMLNALGVSSVKELIYETIPNNILLKNELKALYFQFLQFSNLSFS